MWIAGQVDYPKELTVSLNSSITYNAAVDVRKDPLPADQVINIDKGTAASEKIFVMCRIAARLLPVGDGITVSSDPAAGYGGWIYKDFTPLGVVKWSWSFKADIPKNQELQMELRPVTLVQGESAPIDSYGSDSQEPFITQVTVKSTIIEAMSYWFDTQWKLLVGIAIVISGAIFAVKKWIMDIFGKSDKKTKVTKMNKSKSKKV